MEIGIFGGASGRDPLAGLVDAVRTAHEQGFRSFWTAQIFGLDALTALAVAGLAVPEIQLGTAVIPIHPRHPMMLAQQALTVQLAIGNRLALGIGLSHQVVVESLWGFPWDKPGTYMREYLEALMPLLHDRSVSVGGTYLTARGTIDLGPAATPPVLVAALGPKMLEHTGRLADGTITWMVGPKTLAAQTVPVITAAAERAGRPAPQVAVGLPVCVTDDPAAARERAATDFAIYGQLPSYRAMLDLEGAAGPQDVAIVGSEDEVGDRIAALFDAGATVFTASEFGTTEELARTRALLQSLLPR